MKAEKNPEFLCDIHWSLFEVLVKDSKRYFREILSFFDLPEDKFTYPQKPKFDPKTHMRKGSTDEWRELLSNKQIQKINEVLPEEWFELFNWPKM